jgi:hypothetical protein
MARTQKNKATARHLGMLKARMAKLRAELLAPKTSGGDKGEGIPSILMLPWPFLINAQQGLTSKRLVMLVLALSVRLLP